MAEEISRKAVLVLVIVAVVISLLSTVAVMKTVYQQTGSQGYAPTPTGKVTLKVPPPEGQVALTVVETQVT